MYVGCMDMFFKISDLCFLFFQHTFTLLSNFMLLSHIAQNNVKIYYLIII